MTLLFLLPGDPSRPGHPDPSFDHEARAALGAGARTAVVDLDALLAGDAARAVDAVPAGPEPAWYRGRPLTAARYAELSAALSDRGHTLLTGPDQHAAAHEVRSDAAPSVRVWWVDGVPVLTTPALPVAASDGSTPDGPAPGTAALALSLRETGCRFVTTDLARGADGAWRVVATGDGQTAGLGPASETEAAGLYEALVTAGTGFPLALAEGRLTLRALPPADCARLAEGGTAGLTWIEGAPPEGTVEGAGIMVQLAAAGVYRPGWGTYAITRTEDGVALGGIGFHGPPDADGTVEIGYDLSPAARGAGWATEAARLLASWAMSRPEVRTVTAAAEPANVPSQRVLLRAGFLRVGERSGMAAYAYGGTDGRPDSVAGGPAAPETVVGGAGPAA